MPRRVGIKVGNMMRSRRSQENFLLPVSAAEPYITGVSCLFMPGATVRHHARLWEENG